MTTAVETMQDTPFTIGGRSFHSRLMVGTGKYRDNDTIARAIEASGAEIVTVAVRRVDLDRTKEEGVLYHLDAKRYFLLANTAGCYTAEDAVRYARLAREAGFNEFIKLEVIGDQETLLPDVQGLLVATRTLVAEGFKVLAYTNEDLVTALRLEDAGCAAVMPLASPIGSGLGLLNPFGVRTIKRRLKVPVVVDAGVGTASDACLTMEQGVDGILMNTALAAARDPVAMARAMRWAVEAGRTAYLAGRMPTREVAMPSSPLEGMLDQERHCRPARGTADARRSARGCHPPGRPRWGARQPGRARPPTRVRARGRRAAAPRPARSDARARDRQSSPPRRAPPRGLPAPCAGARAGLRGGVDQRGAGAGGRRREGGPVCEPGAAETAAGLGTRGSGFGNYAPPLAHRAMASPVRARGDPPAHHVERHQTAAHAATCPLEHIRARVAAPGGGLRCNRGAIRSGRARDPEPRNPSPEPRAIAGLR